MKLLPPSESTSLHVLPLPHPHILLPGNRLTLSVSREIGNELIAMIEAYGEKEEEEEYNPPQTRRRTVAKNRKPFLVAAVPVVPSTGSPSTASTETETPAPGLQGDEYLPPIQPQPQPHSNPDSASEAHSHFSEWGVTARILRLVKPSSSSQIETTGGHGPLTVVRGAPTASYFVSLQGLSRVRLLGSSNITPSLPSTTLPLYSISHASSSAPDSEQLDPETLIKFKQSALILLDRLARDSVKKGKREAYIRIAEMLDDLDLQSSSSESLSRAAWMVDVLVGSVINNYNDKLAVLCTPSPSSALFTLASQIFTKHAAIMDVSQKIASAVDDSVSRAQKQFFLKQQLEAIQRELYNLQRQNADSNPTSNGVHEGIRIGPNPNPASQNSDLDAEDDDLNADPSEDPSLFALKRKIEALTPGSEERKMGAREWKRLRRIPLGSVENGVIRSYLEWLSSIPWPSSTLPAEIISSIPSLTLADARAQLDADHFGLDKVKKRLVEYLAVVRLKGGSMSSKGSNFKESVGEKDGKEMVVSDKQQQQEANQIRPPPEIKRKPIKGPILLFVGPPGTGKTSLGQSIARALGRPFQRIALGGVRDEAEIRGHRRTYVASGPGLIVQTLRKMGRGDGVLLLDEVDKIGHSNFHGDPAAALLEALDPEQNHAFNDHYINVPIDLSQILFICTANTLETISLPFLDRCEVIHLSGYTPNEKLSIANRFLLPKQLEANGLDSPQVQITDAAMKEIVNHYTRGEAGVRGLERKIGSVIRAKVVEWADWTESRKGESNTSSNSYNPLVEQHDIERILGIAPWDASIGLSGEEGLGGRAGMVYGLVVMGQGEGGILPVETVMVPGEGKLRLTGMLGDVIKESAELALSWVKTNAYDLGITNSRSDDPLKNTRSVDVHLHLPAGAQKKDGPSAGIAMVCALVSLLTSLHVPPTTALTGEITLRGTISPVGGIKEKVLGAHRAGIRKVILPWANRREVEMDVPGEVRREVKCVFVRSVREAVEEAFGRGTVAWRGGGGGGGRGGLQGQRDLGMPVESRL